MCSKKNNSRRQSWCLRTNHPKHATWQLQAEETFPASEAGSGFLAAAKPTYIKYLARGAISAPPLGFSIFSLFYFLPRTQIFPCLSWRWKKEKKKTHNHHLPHNTEIKTEPQARIITLSGNVRKKKKRQITRVQSTEIEALHFLRSLLHSLIQSNHCFVLLSLALLKIKNSK